MSSKPILDRELSKYIDDIPLYDFEKIGLEGVRKEQESFPGMPAPPAPNIEVTERFIPSADGRDLRLLCYSPPARNDPMPAFLHIHGGGFLFGKPESSDAVNRYRASEIEGVVISVDYRLCPETPFPGPVEDCYTALRWIHDNAESLGIDRRRIAIGGESAGGGLSASLALLARDRGEVSIAFQLLIYPALDDRTGSHENEFIYAHAGEFVWTRENNRFAWQAMLGTEPGDANVSPYAAAARAESLAGLPATFIAVGSLDLFLEENIAYGRRLIQSGVPTELHVYPGAFHAFDLVKDAEITKSFDRDTLAALRRALQNAC